MRVRDCVDREGRLLRDRDLTVFDLQGGTMTEFVRRSAILGRLPAPPPLLLPASKRELDFVLYGPRASPAFSLRPGPWTPPAGISLLGGVMLEAADGTSSVPAVVLARVDLGSPVEAILFGFRVPLGAAEAELGRPPSEFEKRWRAAAPEVRALVAKSARGGGAAEAPDWVLRNDVHCERHGAAPWLRCRSATEEEQPELAEALASAAAFADLAPPAVMAETRTRVVLRSVLQRAAPPPPPEPEEDSPLALAVAAARAEAARSDGVAAWIAQTLLNCADEPDWWNVSVEAEEEEASEHTTWERAQPDPCFPVAARLLADPPPSTPPPPPPPPDARERLAESLSEALAELFGPRRAQALRLARRGARRLAAEMDGGCGFAIVKDGKAMVHTQSAPHGLGCDEDGVRRLVQLPWMAVVEARSEVYLLRPLGARRPALRLSAAAEARARAEEDGEGDRLNARAAAARKRVREWLARDR